ncbi:hypothetical protein DYB32_001990 [Aphanomyces invadans]|uniref:Uncharacterized protein n=1 Tax=Aphanomyces invadans TaxID=157072 RepID=A0A3R6Z363_9STRA|nr:hypothetical protein DYB32_001990 [Aphanomyces invadans]
MADKPSSSMGVVDDVLDKTTPSPSLHLSKLASSTTCATSTTATSPALTPPATAATADSCNDGISLPKDLDDGFSTEASNSSDEREPDYEDHLIKPMPVLAVCPVDVMPSLDTSPIQPFASANMVPLPMHMSSPPLQPNVLKRDPLVLRHQYWNQLGINLSVRDLERSTGRRRVKKEGIKVKLNDTKGKPKPTNIFKAFSRWYTNEITNGGSDTASSPSPPDNLGSTPPSPPTAAADDAKDPVPHWLLQGQLTPPKIMKDASQPSRPSQVPKTIRFEDEADLYYIPVHKEFSKRQRDSMWYSRQEFITMVERNLDEMYEEMEAEVEAQAKLEAMETDAMAAEEARQRQVDAAVKQQQSEMRLQQQQYASIQLRPQHTTVRLAPRGRSPSEIRFKYLKHLGI